MLTYAEALEMSLSVIPPLAPVEIPLDAAAGLVLATPVSARWDMPRFDISAMDGFAVTTGDGTTPLPIAGGAYAGHPFAGRLRRGEAARITTGAPVPDGTLAVVPQEEIVESAAGVTFTVAPQAGEHIRRRGEEYRNGEVLVAAGALLGAGEIGLIASAGVAGVTVHPRPRVALLSTGDELVDLGEDPGDGKIVNSNRYLLSARLRECGCEVVTLGIGRDENGGVDPLTAATGVDLLISTGGVSVGERDFVRESLERRGFRPLFWRVAIKPGKPVLFGLLGEKPYYGLPGNPAAAAATFELFVRPALRRLSGGKRTDSATRKGVLTAPVKGGGGRQAFLWCRLVWDGDRYLVDPAQRQGSGQNRSLQGANALLPVPQGVERLAEGSVVEVLLLEAGW